MQARSQKCNCEQGRKLPQVPALWAFGAPTLGGRGKAQRYQKVLRQATRALLKGWPVRSNRYALNMLLKIHGPEFVAPGFQVDRDVPCRDFG